MTRTTTLLPSRIAIQTSAALCPALPVSRGELAELLVLLVQSLDMEAATFEVSVVDDAAMADLNRRFSGIDAPTNVLSFPGERPDDPDYLGEIALSADTAYREAVLYGQDPTEHVARLLAHAMLHLAGFDHGQAMEAMTDQVILAFRGKIR